MNDMDYDDYEWLYRDSDALHQAHALEDSDLDRTFDLYWEVLA
jgi:hypothetical protein